MRNTILTIAALLFVPILPIVSFSPELAIKPAFADTIEGEMKSIQDEWARIKYQVQGKDAKLAAIRKLETRADAVAKANPSKADPMIWHAIILATEGNISKSLSALPKLEQAKKLLEQSLKIDPKAMEGAAHMTLGSMYYQVPGWPVGFGDDDLSEKHLKQALSINPDGMDTNYWYGAFLLDDGRYAQAVEYLTKAKAAKDRPERAVADKGRRGEIEAALAQAQSKLKAKGRGNE